MTDINKVCFLELLIPTFNRGYVLGKNLDLLSKILSSLGVENLVRFIISDNGSNDDTWIKLNNFKERSNLDVILNRNHTNMGIEANIIKVLELASSPYIMFLGDDDFIPITYWQKVLEVLSRNETTGVIIPQRQTIKEGGDFQSCLTQTNKPNFARYHPNWLSVWQLAFDCNQLSGIVYNRESLLENWFEQKCTNLYPFMTFAGWAALKNTSYKSLGSPVLITEGAKKDWGYRKDGLLGDIIANARYIARGNRLQRVIGELYLLWKWRDRIAMNWVRGREEGNECQNTLFKDKRLLYLTRIILIPVSQILRMKMNLWRAIGRLKSPHIKEGNKS